VTEPDAKAPHPAVLALLVVVFVGWAMAGTVAEFVGGLLR
jgi:hypothetical protein